MTTHTARNQSSVAAMMANIAADLADKWDDSRIELSGYPPNVLLSFVMIPKAALRGQCYRMDAKTFESAYATAEVEVAEEMNRILTVSLERVQKAELKVAESHGTGYPSAIKGRWTIILKTGGKIDAIKLYRALTMQGLKESKDAIESMNDFSFRDPNTQGWLITRIATFEQKGAASAYEEANTYYKDRVEVIYNGES